MDYEQRRPLYYGEVQRSQDREWLRDRFGRFQRGTSAGPGRPPKRPEASQEYPYAYMDRGKGTTFHDFDWVARHLGEQRVAPGQAPSALAWKLYQLYNRTPRSRMRFYEKFLRPFVPRPLKNAASTGSSAVA